MAYDFELLAQIAKNAEDEQEAITGYFNLLGAFQTRQCKSTFYDEAVSQIKSIISEEMKHQDILEKMYQEFSDIWPERI